MRIFTLPEFAHPNYRGTLFAELQVVDFRNPEIIDREPIPCADRIVAFRVAARFLTELTVKKLDGSPDYRFNPITVDSGGDQWTDFRKFLKILIKAKDIGDIIIQNNALKMPVMASTGLRDGNLVPAALMVGLPGWALPLYFDGEFDLFAAAVDRLVNLQSEIASGIAPRIDVQLDAQ